MLARFHLPEWFKIIKIGKVIVRMNPAGMRKRLVVGLKRITINARAGRLHMASRI